MSPVKLGSYFVSAGCRRTWQRRALQITEAPEIAVWITRAVPDDGIVVGRAGFHGRPDKSGMVEVGYAIEPTLRRQAYARAALLDLLRWASSDESIHKVRASIRPDNQASSQLVQQHGFMEVGFRMIRKMATKSYIAFFSVQLAGQFHIYGNEAVTDFMVMANIVISVVLSLLLVFTLPKSPSKPH